MIVLDSSFLIAWHNANDVHHSSAMAGMARFLNGEWGSGLLLEYVFLEVVTVLLVRRGLAAACSAANHMLQARELEFLPCSDFFTRTLETFRGQTRGTLSFTDAAVVTAAREHSHGLVATFDKDFRGVPGITVAPI